MRPETQRVIVAAFNTALSDWVKDMAIALFHDNVSREEFLKHVNLVVGTHKNLVAQFTPDQEIEDAIQGRDRADRPQDVTATHKAKTVWEGGWEGVPQHGGD